MEFIARAGSFIDRSHRVAGFFLIISVVLGFTAMSLAKSNATLASEVERISRTSQVYVVPGSQAGFYAPTQPEMLLQNFGEYVIQSLNTYTYANLETQFQEVQKFFTPEMLLNAKPFYQARISDARQDEHSSLLVTERNTLNIKAIPTPDGGLRDLNYYEYSIEGRRQDIIGAQVIASRNIRIFLTVRQSSISKSNPWGFVLSKYREESL
jgi:hypothetical protein